MRFTVWAVWFSLYIKQLFLEMTTNAELLSAFLHFHGNRFLNECLYSICCLDFLVIFCFITSGLGYLP